MSSKLCKLSFFYHSELYQVMHDEISDMHCMSDEYLVDEMNIDDDK